MFLTILEVLEDVASPSLKTPAEFHSLHRYIAFIQALDTYFTPLTI